MKIVHIITRLILGGAQENTLITCRELAQRGHDVTLITGPALGPEGGLFEQTKNAEFKTIAIENLRRAINPIHDLPAYFELKKLLKQLQPDIVHTHSAKGGILGRYTGWALKGKIQGKDNRLPIVIHGIHGLAFHPYQSRLLNKFYIAVERCAGRKTDAFITVADIMTEKNKTAGIGLDKPYTTAYSAIDEEDFLTIPTKDQIRNFRREHNIPDDAVVVTKIARIFDLKGHEFVIESARQIVKQYPNVIWLFVGDGLLMELRKQQIREAGLEGYFRFTGLMQPGQIPLTIHASDILVHCSLREGLARVLPQAMLCGKPVVSFDIDGAKEVVNENTGFLIEPQNVHQLTDACNRLIVNPDLRDCFGQNGKEQVTRQFSPKVMVDTIETVYNKLLTFQHH